ncbi:hypothetical protein Tco_1499443 [Tanacetum coccineum]
MPALTKDHKRNKDQYAISRGLNTPCSRYGINIIFWKISNVVPTQRNPQYAVSNTWICRDLDNSTNNVLILLDSWTSGLLVYRLPLSVEYDVSTSTGYGVSSSLSNTAYSSLQINTMYPLPLDTTRLSKMDDDLFTYEVEITNIPCDLRADDDSEHEADDMGFDLSDIAFIEWLGSKGDDEVELTDEEFSDNEDEIAEVFRIDTNIFDYETPICSAFNKFNYLLKVDPDLLTKDIMGFKTYDDYKDDWIYEWNKDVPWVDEKPWTDTRVWTEPKPVIHTCNPFNYKTGCSEWPTYSWMNDGYCNGGNLPGTFIIENQLHYQDYEWYEALEDSELKDEALRNKAIMERFIKDDDDDDESNYEQMRRWDIYTNYDDTYKINHDDNEREELCEVHEPLEQAIMHAIRPREGNIDEYWWRIYESGNLGSVGVLKP